MFFGRKSVDARPNLAQLCSDGARVIDVRTQEEFRGGHMTGAVNIPLDNVLLRLAEIKAWNKPVVAVCRSGARSAAATQMLKAAGVDAHNGGAWEAFARTVNA